MNVTGPLIVRAVCQFLVLWLFVTSANAAESFPTGDFLLINSAGFAEVDGGREPLPTSPATAPAHVGGGTNGALKLSVNGTDITLFELETGTAALAWNSGTSGLLAKEDILALAPDVDPAIVRAWGADIAWPGLGSVRLVLMPLRGNAYTGFLISHPGTKTVVRQMELRRQAGPANRPDPDIGTPTND